MSKAVLTLTAVVNVTSQNTAVKASGCLVFTYLSSEAPSTSRLHPVKGEGLPSVMSLESLISETVPEFKIFKARLIFGHPVVTSIVTL